jgi:hypothetical protein
VARDVHPDPLRVEPAHHLGEPPPLGVEVAALPRRLVRRPERVAADGQQLEPVVRPAVGATVANDLVLTSVLSGLILAYDRTTGEEVWRYQAPGSINGWPAVTSDSLIIPVSFGEPPVLLALSLPSGP